MARAPHDRKQKARPLSEATENTGSTVLGEPVFAQPLPTPDPMKFEIKHRSDNPAYKQINVLNREHKLEPMPYPEPRNLPEPRLSLEDILGDGGATAAQKITQSGQAIRLE